MPRVLLLATTTGYQTRTFGEAAERLGVDLVFATDRCHQLDDPWQDGAVPIRFHDEDGSVAAILEAARERPIDGILAVGDRPTVVGARVAAELGLPWHSPEAAAVARNKLRTRERLREAGMPVPWFVPFAIDDPLRGRNDDRRPDIGSQTSASGDQPPPIGHDGSSGRLLTYPCVVKPVSLSGSRGVIRADDPAALAAAIERLRALLRSPDIRAERDDAHARAIVERFIPGREYAVDALMHYGTLHVLAIFDKPDPLDGPFFEETIYVTPPSIETTLVTAIVDAIARAAAAIGLSHGPIHAECRVEPPSPGGQSQVFVLEVAARPIGGLCARALRFEKGKRRLVLLEELLLRHALGEDPDGWRREGSASGVMMIPIPRRGVFRRVDGLDEAREVEHVDEIRITAKTDQLLVPLPEGASYLGFIFVRAERPTDVEDALRTAHAILSFQIDPEFPVRPLEQMRYNSSNG